jgi:hypothetical protein
MPQVQIIHPNLYLNQQPTTDSHNQNNKRWYIVKIYSTIIKKIDTMADFVLT